MVINPLSLFECVLPARGWADPSACQPLVSERLNPPVHSDESLCVVSMLRPSLLAPVPPALRPLSLVVASPHEGRGKGTCLPPTVVVLMSPPTGATPSPTSYPRVRNTPMARTPPPPIPGTSYPPLMPHASYALSAPSPQGHSPFFSPLGQPPFFTPLGLAGVWLVPVPGPPLPRGTLRFAFLSDDKPRRSPQRAIFFVSVAFICYLLSAFLSSCVSVP